MWSGSRSLYKQYHRNATLLLKAFSWRCETYSVMSLKSKNNTTQNKPLVSQTNCEVLFLRVLVPLLWLSLPLFPSRLTGSVQHPCPFQFLLKERPGTYSVGNWHEQQPVHIAEVALQIPEKGKKRISERHESSSFRKLRTASQCRNCYAVYEGKCKWTR